MKPFVQHFVSEVLSYCANIISIVLIGSNKDDEVSEDSDYDVVVLINDLRMNNVGSFCREIKKLGEMINSRLHVQTYLLSDFWNHVQRGTPFTLSILNDSKIVYDIGFFTIIKNLYDSKIITSKNDEIERQKSIAKQKMNMTYYNVKKGLPRDLEEVVVRYSQSVLMKMGVDPPKPNKIPDYIHEHLVKKNLLEKEYYIIAKKIINTYKKIEHGDKRTLPGRTLQKMYNDAHKFATRMESLLNKLKK